MDSHHLILENRESLSISGVTDVDSFDTRTIILRTTEGELTIQGKNLKMHSVSTESGNMTISGEIWTLRYGERGINNRKTFLGRLFQ